MNVEFFIDTLKEADSSDNVFNFWNDNDEVNDLIAGAAYLRRENFRRYLEHRFDKAHILVLAKKPSFADAKFTGIPLCDESLLLGNHDCLNPEDLFHGEKLRTSSWACDYKLMSNKSGNDIQVWQTMKERGIPPEAWVAWNVYPFHAHQSGFPLSDREVSAEELFLCRRYTEHLLHLYPKSEIWVADKAVLEVLQQIKATSLITNFL